MIASTNASSHGRAALVADIVEHHVRERRVLPYIVTLLARVAGFHGRRNEKLKALCEAGHELADALEAHLDDAERQLFPVLASGAREIVWRDVNRMLRSHRRMERLLAQIRSFSDGYLAPEWGDHGYRALMEELEALENVVTEHMHLETYALVPGFCSGRLDAAA